MSWYKNRSTSYVLRQMAKAVTGDNDTIEDYEAMMGVDAEENIHAHPLMGWIESLNSITNQIKMSDSASHAFDLHEIEDLSQCLNPLVSQFQEDETLAQPLAEASNHLDDLLLLIQTQRKYEDQYIAYFFTVMALRQIGQNKISRAVVDMPAPEVRFAMDENLVGENISVTKAIKMEDKNIIRSYEKDVSEFHNDFLTWMLELVENKHERFPYMGDIQEGFDEYRGLISGLIDTYGSVIPAERMNPLVQMSWDMDFEIKKNMYKWRAFIRWEHDLKPTFEKFRQDFGKHNDTGKWNKLPQ